MVEQIEIEVPEELERARVDKALAELFGVSRAEAAAIVADGVAVDGRAADASDRVRAGQVIRCREPGGSQGVIPERVDFGVLYEDPSAVVVDKPAGVVVHPGARRMRGTLVAGLIEQYPDLVGVGSPGRWGLVHRLDKDTSGTLLVARTESSFESLSEQMRRRDISRSYTALVEGQMDALTGTIEAPIGRDPARPTRQTITHGGRHARTHFEVTRYYTGSAMSLLAVRLETGRTHQIRVHLASIGHPVAGDVTYGAILGEMPRTFLHASSLEWAHPESGDRITTDSPLPTDLVTVLDVLS